MKHTKNKAALSGLVQYGKHFYERRWMWGTAGNLSVKLRHSPLLIGITPSGLNKGALKTKDLLVLNDRGNGKHPLGRVPSAETAIHQAIHRALPDCGAVFHVHPVYPTLVSKVFGDAHRRKMLAIPWSEMMKGVGMKENQTAQLPIFPNWQDISKLAKEVERYLRGVRGRPVPAILIYGHGLTAWGRTTEEARNHLEVLDWVCEYLYLQRMLKAKR